MTNLTETKHPESGNLQGAGIISYKETTDNKNDRQDFSIMQEPSHEQAVVGDFSEIVALNNSVCHKLIFSELRELGFNVIPIIYGDKKPAIKWTQYQTKLVTHEQCKEWEGKHYNVGIITGAISNIFVLDVDGDAGAMTLATLEAQYGALPATLTATSGKGKHFYFVYPNDGSVIRNLSGQSV